MASRRARRRLAAVPDDLPPKFAVVVPCYNEEGAVAQTIEELRRHVGPLGPAEIVAVDDGSTDATAARLAAEAQAHADVRLVRHDVNQGYGAALKSGIRAARAPLIVITDADGTYPNERIGDLLAKMADHDMAVGARVAPGEVTYPLIRRLPKIFLARYASWIARTKIPDINSGLRVFRKDLAEKYFHVLPGGFSFTTTITLCLLTNYYRVAWVPIGYKARVGKSKIKPVRDTFRFVVLITRTGMYFAPLRLMLIPAAVLFVAFCTSLAYDLAQGDLGDKTVLLLVFLLNVVLFALLADMIDKRAGG